MAIADTITSMYENVGNVYDVLELAGADLTNVDKNIQNLKQSWEERLLYFLANGTDTLWNNWEKVSGSGTSLSLNNTIEAKMDFVYKGNTSQETTTGKNLLNDYDLASRYHISSVEGNLLTTTSSSSNYDTFQPLTKTQTIQLNQGTEYYVSLDMRLKSGTYSNPLGGINLINLNGSSLSTNTEILNSSMTSNFQRYCYKCTASLTTNERIGIMIQLRAGASNAVFEIKNIMISTSSDTNYEKYTGGNPAPNPDYPQDIQVVSGDNTIKVEGKNLLINNFVLGSINAYGKDIGNNTRARSDYNIVQENSIYCFSSSNSKIYYVPYFYDENKTFISYIDGWKDQSVTFTTPANTKYVRLIFKNNDTNNIVLNELTNMQLEKGSTATTYEPYQSQSHLISLGVENLINPALFTTTGSYNVASINNGEVISSSITGYAGVRIALGQDINLKTNDEIYVRLKLKSDVAGDVFNTIQLFNSSNAGITSTEVKLSTPTLTTEYQEYIIKYTIGTDETLNKLFIQHKGSSSNVFIIKDIQISYKNGSYTSYGTTPIELCKIGDYQDKIAKSSGKNLFDKDNIDIQNGYLDYRGIFVSANDWWGETSFIKIKPNTQYTFSCRNIGARFIWCEYTNDSVGSIVGQRHEGSTTFTTSNTSQYIRFCTNSTTTTDIQLNEGTTALPYEPYGKVWYLNKQIGKIVLDGTQNITLASGTPRRFNATYTTLGINNVKSGSTALETQNNYRMCDYFYYASGVNTWGVYYLHNNWLVLLDSGSAIASASDLATWLSNNPTTIYYVLATPTYEEITDTTLISQLEAIKKSYNTQTNISQTNASKPFILDVVALGELD